MRARPFTPLLMLACIALFPQHALAVALGPFPYIEQEVPKTQTQTIELPLFLNKNRIGAARALIGPDGGPIRRIEASGLEPWVKAHLSPTAQAAFHALIAPDGSIALKQMPKAGLTLSYDEDNVLLRLNPDPAALEKRTVSVIREGAMPEQPPLRPARLSGFINLRAGEDYTRGAPQQSGRQPLRLGTDGAVNLKGWVLEGEGDYLEGADTPWQRGNVRVVHDLPDKMVRLAAGDLSYPIDGFQSYQPIAGVSIARNFALQPYRVTAPTGQTSFILRSPSRVDILVNGVRLRTLQLAPGPYDIADFPVADGGNDVTLVITDATGHREKNRFPC